jgi:hypothetical protein
MALDQDVDIEVYAVTTAITEDTQTVVVGDQVGKGGWHMQSVCGWGLIVIPAGPLYTQPHWTNVNTRPAQSQKKAPGDIPRAS